MYIAVNTEPMTYQDMALNRLIRPYPYVCHHITTNHIFVMILQNNMNWILNILIRSIASSFER